METPIKHDINQTSKPTKARRRRGDLRVGRLEREAGVDFGVRSDMHLRTLRDLLGERELQRLLRAGRPLPLREDHAVAATKSEPAERVA